MRRGEECRYSLSATLTRLPSEVPGWVERSRAAASRDDGIVSARSAMSPSPSAKGTIVFSAGFRHVRVNHLRRIDDPVELGFRYKSQLQCGLLEGKVVIQRVVRNLRRFVIANDGRKCGHQHERAGHIFLDLLQIRLRPFDQEFP